VASLLLVLHLASFCTMSIKAKSGKINFRPRVNVSLTCSVFLLRWSDIPTLGSQSLGLLVKTKF
jgi:hypothetical protein